MVMCPSRSCRRMCCVLGWIHSIINDLYVCHRSLAWTDCESKLLLKLSMIVPCQPSVKLTSTSPSPLPNFPALCPDCLQFAGATDLCKLPHLNFRSSPDPVLHDRHLGDIYRDADVMSYTELTSSCPDFSPSSTENSSLEPDPSGS